MNGELQNESYCIYIDTAGNVIGVYCYSWLRGLIRTQFLHLQAFCVTQVATDPCSEKYHSSSMATGWRNTRRPE